MVKNVPHLTVGVYEIDLLNYYKKFGKEVDIEDINLDGLFPRWTIEKTYKDQQSNLFLLAERSIELRELREKRGVFLVEFLGNGKRARLMIRKDHLRYICKQEFVDENGDGKLGYVMNVVSTVKNQVITNSRLTILLSDECLTFDSDSNGNIFIPYASEENYFNVAIVVEDLQRVNSATLHGNFNYLSENYRIETCMFIDREQLINSQQCQIFVRPLLFLNNEPISVTNLKNCQLFIHSTCANGESYTKRYRLDSGCTTVEEKKSDEEKANADNDDAVVVERLSDDKECIVGYDIPSELRTLRLVFKCTVTTNACTDERLSSEVLYKINAIDNSFSLGQCLFLNINGKYFIKIIGKNGELLVNEKICVRLKHKYFKDLLQFNMQSNKDGLVCLGILTDIECVQALAVDNTRVFPKFEWKLLKNKVNIPRKICIDQGNDVLIPLITDSITPRCDVYDCNFTRRIEMNVSYNAGYIRIQNLVAGDYIAMIRDVQCADVYIHVTAGVIVNIDHSVGRDRILQLSEPRSLQILGVKGDRGNGYKVKLDGYSYNNSHVSVRKSKPVVSKPVVKPKKEQKEEKKEPEKKSKKGGKTEVKKGGKTDGKKGGNGKKGKKGKNDVKPKKGASPKKKSTGGSSLALNRIGGRKPSGMARVKIAPITTRKVSSSSSTTRVHAIASYTVPTFDVFRYLASPTSLPNTYTYDQYPIVFSKACDISVEEAYVHNRRNRTSDDVKEEKSNGLQTINRGGNAVVLPVPSLLLNQWTSDISGKCTDTIAVEAPDAKEDEVVGNGVEPEDDIPSSVRELQFYSCATTAFDAANLDMLQYPSRCAFNLECDSNGIVCIPHTIFEDNHLLLTIIAIDDNNTSVKYIHLNEIKQSSAGRAHSPWNDIRLQHSEGFDCSKHYSLTRNIYMKNIGQEINFMNWNRVRVETYDDWSDLYEFYYNIAVKECESEQSILVANQLTYGSVSNLRSSLSLDKVSKGSACIYNNELIARKKSMSELKLALSEFSFLCGWYKMSVECKLHCYDKYSCNELNFFLLKRDPKFFDKIVCPLIKNKLQKSFFDHYLLGNNDQLEKYALRLDLYLGLNVFEKIILAFAVDSNDSITNAKSKNLLRNLKDMIEVQSATSVQSFNCLFSEALRSKQTFEATKMREEEVVAVVVDDESKAVVDDCSYKYNSKQYQESRYYKRHFSEQCSINANAFWLDYALYLAANGGVKRRGDGFLSQNFGFAANSTAEVLLALSVIDLPFRGQQNEPCFQFYSSDTEEKSVLTSYEQDCVCRVTINGPTMLLAEEICVTPFSSSSLAVATNYFTASDVNCDVSNNAFTAGIIYGARIVITNVSSIVYITEVLVQIPVGSVPVNCGFRSKTFSVELASYATEKIEYYFYFPIAGAFTHYPAQISRNGVIIGCSLDDTSLTVNPDGEVVQDEKTAETAGIQNATELGSGKTDVRAVLEFLKHDINRFWNCTSADLDRLSWRCAEYKFFKECTSTLRRRRLYNARIWRYSLVHDECELELQEYLSRNDKFMKLLAPALTAGNTGDDLFVCFDAVQRKQYSHVEFFKKNENILGLFNTRVHWNKIYSEQINFTKYYRKFLIRCLYRSSSIATLCRDDKIAGVYWMIAQNRIKDARKLFASVTSPGKNACDMSYDYLQVFISFFDEDRQKAVAYEDLVHKYLKMQLVPSKRKLWLAVRQQIQELNDRMRTLKLFTKKAIQVQPCIQNICVNKKLIEVQCSASPKINSLRLNFYDIDLELLFSNAPFSSLACALNYISPTVTIEHDFKDDDSKDDTKEEKSNADGSNGKRRSSKRRKSVVIEVVRGKVTLPLPAGIAESSSFIVEVVGVDRNDVSNDKGVCSATHVQYNHNLYVEFNRGRHDMFVGNFSKFPVECAYVKVYIQTEQHQNGYFLKDGYTDLRGRFDYLETNTKVPNNARSVAVFVQSKSCGANVYRVDI